VLFLHLLYLRVAMCCSVLRRVAVCCSVVQCVSVFAVCFNVLQGVHDFAVTHKCQLTHMNDMAFTAADS